MVAGLEDTTAGNISIGDRVVTDLPPRERDIAMVFQNYALYPHKTVFDNLAFPLKLRDVAKDEIEQRVKRIARMLDLEEQLPRKPRQLSGGQRQRVAMGRAIVREPQAFLMDEPLSNLDAKLRTQMRAEISKLQHQLGVTTIYVTHDQIEAMTLGDRVALMRKGELQQVGSPKTLYDYPTNLFVAGFIGSPAMNFVNAELSRSDGQAFAGFGSHRLRVDERELQPMLEEYVGRRIILGVRPEHLQDAAVSSDAPEDRRFAGSAQVREELGSEVVVHFEVEAAPSSPTRCASSRSTSTSPRSPSSSGSASSSARSSSRGSRRRECAKGSRSRSLSSPVHSVSSTRTRVRPSEAKSAPSRAGLPGRSAQIGRRRGRRPSRSNESAKAVDVVLDSVAEIGEARLPTEAQERSDAYCPRIGSSARSTFVQASPISTTRPARARGRSAQHGSRRSGCPVLPRRPCRRRRGSRDRRGEVRKISRVHVVPRNTTACGDAHVLAEKSRLDDVFHVVRREPTHAEAVQRRGPHDTDVEPEVLVWEKQNASEAAFAAL